MEQFLAAPGESKRNNPPVPKMESSAPSIVPSFPSVVRPEPTIVVEPRNLPIPRAQPRSFARRIGERLILGIAALALFGAWLWMGEQHQGTTRSSPLPDAVESPEAVTPQRPAISRELDAAITAVDANPLTPSWLTPDILYEPKAPPLPSAPPLAEVPLPIPRPAHR